MAEHYHYTEREQVMIEIIKKCLRNRSVCKMRRLRELISMTKERLGGITQEDRRFIKEWLALFNGTPGL